ncbi:hypothetical protein QBC42DRAFT_344268 [Cladorrhinum samala]|uniref:F-box domain-containing protein n=1 Tax=Cladorrhinum samala TaxID=585594 RepID=A0AAV9HXX2_9PEZI|nr:hypothetical protein QBC42DRAFT_344268 [Cladorrhinum samala]
MATFVTLPLELVDAVMELLCPRCSLNSRRSRTLVHSLLALCLTSKFFNRVATRHLYHRPALHRWPMLARTLLARPDLAGHVKQILAPDTIQSFHFRRGLHWDYEIDVPSDVEAYYRAIVREIDDDDALETQTAPEDVLAERMAQDMRSDFIPIVASLCPNLQKLEVEYRDNYRPVLSICKPNTLPKVKKAKVTRKFQNLGCDFEIFQPLVDAAPNMERLVLNCLSGCSEWEGMRLENLTHLDLMESSLRADDLARLLGACPNLEILEYECGGLWASEYDHWNREGESGDPTIAQFTPEEARDVILEYAEKLEFFRFNIIHHANDPDVPHSPWAKDKIDLLKNAMENRGIEFQLIASFTDYAKFK